MTTKANCLALQFTKELPGQAGGYNFSSGSEIQPDSDPGDQPRAGGTGAGGGGGGGGGGAGSDGGGGGGGGGLSAQAPSSKTGTMAATIAARLNSLYRAMVLEPVTIRYSFISSGDTRHVTAVSSEESNVDRG